MVSWRFSLFIFTISKNLNKMSLISTAPFSNVTVYRKEYIKKSCPRVLIINPDRDFGAPIAGPEPEDLLTDLKRENFSKSQKDTKGLDGQLDLDLIEQFRQDDKRTIYMMSYCTRGDYESKVSRKRIRYELPKDWAVPLTTQKCSYRAPCLKIATVQKYLPKDNLSPNLKVREILEVKTGESIYISDISNTGMEIIKGKLHGDVNIRPKFNEDDLLKAKLIRTD